MTTIAFEDYLEAIYELEKEKGCARTGDISSMLGVQPPSVTEMMQRLSGDGFIEYKKYRGARLTGKGEKIAKEVMRRHKILIQFLQIIGVDEKTAEEDACKIEHVTNPGTMERLTKFVEFVQEAPKNPKWLEHFEHYITTGKHPECEG